MKLTVRIKELEKLAEKATPGPWVTGKYSVSEYLHVDGPVSRVEGCAGSATFFNDNDAILIAASRTAVPELCKAIKELEQELHRCVHVMGEALTTPDCPASREYIGACLEDAVFSARALIAKLG